MKFLDVIAPTLDFGPGAISRVPFKKIESSLYLEKFIKKSIQVAKSDWDSYENSWDFKRNPLI